MQTGMPRSLLTLSLTCLLAGACTKSPPPPTTAPLAAETINDDSGSMKVDLGYTPKGSSIDFVVQLKGVGTTEMDKVVVEVDADGLEFVSGQMQWSGFVPPHSQHTHAVSLQPEGDAEFGTVTVTVSRSVDSHVLLQREVPFRVANGKLVPDA